ncbi:hypothetical protein [Streptomyces atacamensis]|uniref:hypothetical protein n=1 Tax=Streptomyces atacamensis TaxID=531966 RepID=UPI00399D43F0
MAAAVQLARRLPTDHPRVGILRGWNRTDRSRARMLRNRLITQHGIHAVDLSPLPEAGQRHRAADEPERPRVDLLLHTGGAQSDHALRAAALWSLPLLTPNRCDKGDGALNAFHARRRPVIGIRLPSGSHDIAVREAALHPVQPEAHTARLDLDDQTATVPLDQPVRITLTPEGMLEVRSEALGVRRARHLRCEPDWGVFRLDVDGTPAHDFRAPLHLESLPGRLHLMCP